MTRVEPLQSTFLKILKNFLDVDFSGLTFNQTSCLGKGSVANANFADAKINYSTWANSPDVTVEQIKTTRNYKNREMCFMLGNTDLDWSGNDFSGFTLAGSNLDGSNVKDADFTGSIFLGYYWTGSEIVLDRSVYKEVDYIRNTPGILDCLREYSLKNCQGLTKQQIDSTRNGLGTTLPDEVFYQYVEF